MPANGTTQGSVTAYLYDSNGNAVSGKTVTLTANTGSSAKISPPSGVSTAANGAVVFSITDLNPENSTFTATDTTDGIKLTQTATATFVTPSAAEAGIEAFPTGVTNDGVSTTTITVTLKDGLGRPSPGKLVTLSQGSGNSVIKSPNPAVTNSSGQIEFTATDITSETVTYSATDVTDGNLTFPGTAVVTFSGNPANACATGNPIPAGGFGVDPFASGFAAQSFNYGNVDWGCPGAWGMAFDAAKNLYVSNFFNGNLYKFGTAGGVAGPGTLLGLISPTLGGLTFGKNGSLYGGIAASSSSFSQGSVVQIDPTTGVVLRTIASDLTCPYAIATDPISGDLFVDDGCSGAGSDNPSIWRISNLSSTTPTVTVYATLPNTPNFQLSFAPNGTLYAVTGAPSSFNTVAEVSGTDGPSPATVTNIHIFTQNLGLVALGEQASGAAQSLITAFGSSPVFPAGLTTLDLTVPSEGITPSSVLISPGLGNVDAVGPDGCVYAAQADAVFKVTNSNGTCPFVSGVAAPTLSLAPTVATANPAQSTSVSFTAMFHYLTVPASTPVFFQVTGANAQSQVAPSFILPAGQASFSYTGVNAGQDTIVASATVGTQTFTSNPVSITWRPGQHTTFLSLNQSSTTATVDKLAAVTASLSDVSVSPVAPIKGGNVQFNLGSSSCAATTDAKGNASCGILAPGFGGQYSLTASYGGATEFVAANAAIGFTVTAPPTIVPTFTPRPTGTATATPRPTPTLTPIPTPIASHTPIATPTPRRTLIPTPTPTPPECIATTPKPTVPVPTPTPLPGHPRIKTVQSPVLAGGQLHHQWQRLYQGLRGQLLRQHFQRFG